MKLKNKIISMGLMTVLLAIATRGVQASVTFTNLITISATMELQGEANNNGTVVTYGSPVKTALGTKQLLAFMAIDENAEANYSSNAFPVGAKLVEVDSTNGADYQVLDVSNRFLVDVSDIFAVEHNTNDVYFGKISDATGLADPTMTSKYLVRYSYDDLAIAGGARLKFLMYGLNTKTITDTTPNGEGVFKETKRSVASRAIGAGNYQGTHFVMTGSLIQTRADIFRLNP